MPDAIKTEPPKAKERKPTATQARAARRARRKARRGLVRYAAFTGVGIIAIIFILALFLPGLPFGRASGGASENAPGQRIDNQGQAHIQPGE